jgi:urate oxidase
MREEEARRKKVGSMAYYKEWVKAWRQDTSKAVVEENAKKTGEGVVDQLLDMLSHQSLMEYRKMQGPDIRIARDPLTMRMPEEEVKQGMSLNFFCL